MSEEARRILMFINDLERTGEIEVVSRYGDSKATRKVLEDMIEGPLEKRDKGKCCPDFGCLYGPKGPGDVCQNCGASCSLCLAKRGSK